MAYFPFMIDIKDKNCLVVGGGSIALHKVKILLGFGVYIKVIGEEICDELRSLEDEQPEKKDTERYQAMHTETVQDQGLPKLQIVQKSFEESDIDGMDFVVAATDDETLNYRISELCRQKKILVNAVDMKEACSFIFPAMIQEKDLLVAVSTGGQSPAAAAYVKRQIKEKLPGYYGDLIDTLGEYRDLVLEQVDTPKKRKKVFEQLLEYGDIHGGEIPAEIVHSIICEINERKQ